MTPPVIEAATFRLAAQCLNQLRHCVPPDLHVQYDLHHTDSDKNKILQTFTETPTSSAIKIRQVVYTIQTG
jgi:hypothetical protein